MARCRPKKQVSVLSENNPLAGVVIGIPDVSTAAPDEALPGEELDIWTNFTVEYRCRCKTIRSVRTVTLDTLDRLMDVHGGEIYSDMRCPHCRRYGQVNKKKTRSKLPISQTLSELTPE